MGKGYVLVEGHGETLAVGNLLNRLCTDLQLPFLSWQVLRWLKLDHHEGVVKGCEFIRRRNDVAALLILRDEDDACPQELGPLAAGWVEGQKLPFPAAVVLLHREYEALFLPCVDLMADMPLEDPFGNRRPGLRGGTSFDGDPERIRGVKEWLSRHLPPGRSYKPTVDQLPLTRMLDFDVLRRSRLPCFGTLERALLFLSEHQGKTGVYPPPKLPTPASA